MDAFEEPIRILSDLHLAHPGSRIVDTVQLAPLLMGVKTVIFNGDTCEERMKKFRDAAEQHLVTLKALCDEAGITMVMIRGNHDPYTPPLGAVDLAGGEVFVTHGDVLYPDVSPWSRNLIYARKARLRIEEDYPDNYRDDLESALEVSRRVTEEMRVHQPKARQGVKGKIKTVLSQAWPPTRPMTILKVWWQTSQEMLRILGGYRPDAKVLIIGHTHRAFCKRKDGKLLVNTGAFLTMSSSLAVDIAGGELVVRKIVSRSGEFVLGKELDRQQL